MQQQSTYNHISNPPSPLDNIFLALYNALLISKLDTIHDSVGELKRFVDYHLTCGHNHGRRLPMHRIYELVRAI